MRRRPAPRLRGLVAPVRKRMTTAERLWRWLRRTRGAVCDDCIAQELELPGRRQANRAARLLADQANFYRDKGVCALCGATKMVIESL